MVNPSDTPGVRLADDVTVADAINLIALINDSVSIFKLGASTRTPDQNSDEFRKLALQLDALLGQAFDSKGDVPELVTISEEIDEGKARKNLPEISAKEISEKIMRELDILSTRLRYSSASTAARTAAPASSIENSFDKLAQLLEVSPLSEQISIDEYKSTLSIAGVYLEEARKAHRGKANVACIVMLAAMLEALMMGTLIRDDLDKSVRGYVHAHSDIIKGGSNQKRLDMCHKVVNLMDFEKYRKAIEEIMPASKSAISAKVIQDFRNSLHANASLKEGLYLRADEKWVEYHLLGLCILVKILNEWKPV